MKRLITMFLCCGMISAFGSDAVKASQWGFHAENATECLQKAIDSGAPKILVDNMGKDWIVDKIRLRSDLELTFADGVTVRALPGAFHGLNDSLFEATDCKNISLKGNGKVRLVMNKKDYQDIKRYKPSEWRNTLCFRGCENVLVSGLSLESSGGDGIYIGTSSRMRGCRNVVIEQVTASDHHRQGISVISVDGLKIRHSKFSNTAGTPPMAGIDFEPNKPDEWITGCEISDCEFENNAVGILLYLNLLTAQTKPLSVTFRNCRLTGNRINMMLSASGTTPVKGNVVFENCRMDSAKSNSVILSNLQEDAMKVLFKNCLIDNGNTGASAVTVSTNLLPDIAGIAFENSKIITGGSRPLEFQSLSGAGVTGIQGSLNIQEKNGKESKFDFRKFMLANKPDEAIKNFKVATVDLKQLVPGGKGKKEAKSKFFRKKFKILQYVESGKPVKLDFTVRKIYKNPINITVDVKDSNGTPVDQFKITKPSQSYILKKNSGSEVMLLEVNTGLHAVALASGQPGQAILADTRTGMFYASGARFYFMVPAGAADIRLEVAPDLGEPVGVELLDPSGRSMASFSKSDSIRQLVYKRGNTAETEIWSVRFPYVHEDMRFRVGAPLLPLVSTAPENILIPRDTAPIIRDK